MPINEDKRTGKRVKSDRSSTSPKKHPLDTLFEAFYYAKIAEGVTDRTLESYRENYKFFTEFLNERNIVRDIRNITLDTIREYIVYMLEEKVRFDGHKFKSEEEKTVGLSPVTVNTRLKTLKTMFKYLLNEGQIITNPMEKIKKVEEDEDEIVILTTDELKKLLAVPGKLNIDCKIHYRT